MERAAGRAGRLAQIQYLLFHSSNGLSCQQLASKLGVGVRTVQRDLITLEADLGVPLVQDGRRYAIGGNYILPPIGFTLHEARALFLATRLLLRFSDEHDANAASAIERLAGVLPTSIGGHVRQTAESLRNKPVRKELTSVLESITEAWARARLMRIEYYSRERPQLHEARVEPYFLEVGIAGSSTYLIANSLTHGAIRTFKVERIKTADILEEEFSPPAIDDLVAALGQGWGVYLAEDDEWPEVEIRFSASVAFRLSEAMWHPSQKLSALPGGGCVLTFKAPSLVEVLPWIRGWGPDAEVLKPQALREVLASETAAAATMYGTKVYGS